MRKAPRVCRTGTVVAAMSVGLFHQMTTVAHGEDAAESHWFSASMTVSALVLPSCIVTTVPPAPTPQVVCNDPAGSTPGLAEVTRAPAVIGNLDLAWEKETVSVWSIDF